ncbi:MAG TPA: hypothetical protein VLA93_01105 [Pyrinomonadaceae bacterium]|nr:hypothetical protein [Pyrinomonadaceae bacterium]
MRNLLPLILALLVLPVPQSQETSSLSVVSFKWAKTKQAEDKIEVFNPAPAPAMIPQNKNFSRNVRMNEPPGARDPNQDTVDGRSAALEKSVQESRARPPRTIDAYSYKVKIQNPTSQSVDILFWEYQFIDRAKPENMTRRQFLCVANIKPGKDKEIQALSLNGPTDVVNVDSLANGANPFDEKIVINRIEWGDGSIWQRKAWKFGEIRESYRRATSTPWSKEMCRVL